MKDTQQQEAAFIALIRQHERLVHKVCGLYTANNSEDYKDLFQEIVLQAWRAFPAFRQDAKPSTWLYRIALNTAINHKRKTGRKLPVISFDGLFEQFAEEQQSGDEKFRLLWSLIQQLPELERALILLYLEDNSYEEIAAIMGLTVTNTGTRLARIKDKLKRQVQEHAK